MKQLKCNNCSAVFTRKSANGPIPKFCKKECYLGRMKKGVTAEVEAPIVASSRAKEFSKALLPLLITIGLVICLCLIL